MRACVRACARARVRGACTRQPCPAALAWHPPTNSPASNSSNLPPTPQCGDTGEVNYKLPELAPLQTKAIKASWKMPDTPGVAVVLVFVDSACTAFNQTGEEGQASFYTTVVEAGTEYAYLQVALPYSSLGEQKRRARFVPGQSSIPHLRRAALTKPAAHARVDRQADRLDV